MGDERITESYQRIYCQIAAELLVDGLSFLNDYIDSLDELISRLYHLSLMYRNNSLGKITRRSLVSTVREIPKEFIICMGNLALDTELPIKRRSLAIWAMKEAIRENSKALENKIHIIIEIIIQCLDPTDPEVRKHMFSHARDALHVIEQK